MEQLELYWVDAFTNQPFSGNPAGVIVNADHLSEDKKQQIAKELNISETMFVSQSKIADFKVQFFTPKQETDLCGHGTVATFWVLSSIGKIKKCKNTIVSITQETKAGVLPIDIYFDNDKNIEKVMMYQTNPIFYDVNINVEEITSILEISENQIDGNYPLKIVSTGRPKLFIPVISRKELYDIKPDFDKITDYCAKKEITGFHLFTFDTHYPKSITTARHFAPIAGVNEDPVTGIAGGALGCYLSEFEKAKSFLDFQMEQGFNMGREGIVNVEIEKEYQKYKFVKVGGKAHILFNTKIILK